MYPDQNFGGPRPPKVQEEKFYWGGGQTPSDRLWAALVIRCCERLLRLRELLRQVGLRVVRLHQSQLHRLHLMWRTKCTRTELARPTDVFIDSVPSDMPCRGSPRGPLQSAVTRRSASRCASAAAWPSRSGRPAGGRAGRSRPPVAAYNVSKLIDK